MYIMKLWNGKYGNACQFIVERDGKYTLFSPARPKDITWVKEDLTQNADYKDWESFEDEPVEDLSMVIM